MKSRVRPQIVVDVARLVRTTRTGLRLTQRSLSRRSGVSQSRICRLENEVADDLSLAELDALLTALDVRYWLGTDVPRLTRANRDLVHGWCTAYAARRLVADGWLVEREVEISDGRWKGWIDILAFHPASGHLLVIEVKTEVVDIGEIERTLNWYQREAVTAAGRFGWSVRAVDSALLVLHADVNEQVIGANRELLTLGFPGRAAGLESLVREGRRTGGGRYLALIDPHSRRAAWLRPTRSEGRRSPAPFADYIDAARRVEQGRRA